MLFWDYISQDALVLSWLWGRISFLFSGWCWANSIDLNTATICAHTSNMITAPPVILRTSDVTMTAWLPRIGWAKVSHGLEVRWWLFKCKQIWRHALGKIGNITTVFSKISHPPIFLHCCHHSECGTLEKLIVLQYFQSGLGATGIRRWLIIYIETPHCKE